MMGRGMKVKEARVGGEVRIITSESLTLSHGHSLEG